MSWVVDASVAIKWVVPEELSEHADRLLADGGELLAPDLLFVEAANALWKKTRRRELTEREADGALNLLQTSGLVVRPSAAVIPRALQLAAALDHPVYDCVYLALAERERLPFVTADTRILARSGRRRLRVRVHDLRKLSPPRVRRP